MTSPRNQESETVTLERQIAPSASRMSTDSAPNSSGRPRPTDATAPAIPLVDVCAQFRDLRDEIQSAMEDVLTSGAFILGPAVRTFEEAFAHYCGARHAIGVGSGLDALTLMLRGSGIGPGDEVILPANTFVATALAVLHAGATPVLVDHDPVTYTIDPVRTRDAVTDRTRAILPVHLYGQPADMDAIHRVAADFGLLVFEDAAQAHGAHYGDLRCGSLAHAAAFSFYPGKNLGAAGDGGVIVTDDAALADHVRAARSYGSRTRYHHDVLGFNSRLDSLQAAILNVKLKHLDAWNASRADIADRYRTLLADCGAVLPNPAEECEHVYHLFVIRCAARDDVLAHLKAHNILAGIHYPIPIHRLRALAGRCRVHGPLTYTEAFAGQLLSLPIYPQMTREQVDAVAQALRSFPGDLTPVPNYRTRPRRTIPTPTRTGTGARTRARASRSATPDTIAPPPTRS